MLTLRSKRAVKTCDGLTRRDFLAVGGVGTIAALLARSEAGAVAFNDGPQRAVIQLNLVGGPSQLETWDPKPNAPSTVRGPFAPIATAVPGINICETFPRMARMVDRFALVRTLHHDEAPIHETGLQLLQTGRLSVDGVDAPHLGAIASAHLGPQRGMPAWVGLSRPIGDTGVDIARGQTAAGLGPAHEAVWLNADRAALSSSADVAIVVDDNDILGGRDGPALRQLDALRRRLDRHADENATHPQAAAALVRALLAATDSPSIEDRYGRHSFGRSCLAARRLVETGVRFVTINMFDTVFGNVSWDMHAAGGELAVTVDDYREIVCPMFDQGFSALVEDLADRGLLATTLVVAAGEFGRTPTFNRRGGRDHWPGAWTALAAGGGVRGGQAIGETDETASVPKDRPVAPAELVATMLCSLGIDPRAARPAIVDAPIHELF